MLLKEHRWCSKNVITMWRRKINWKPLLEIQSWTMLLVFLCCFVFKVRNAFCRLEEISRDEVAKQQRKGKRSYEKGRGRWRKRRNQCIHARLCLQEEKWSGSMQVRTQRPKRKLTVSFWQFIFLVKWKVWSPEGRSVRSVHAMVQALSFAF